jgi:hypothetical protein
MQVELRNFFDAYLESWPKGPAAIAEFYSEPCLTARAGTLKVHLSRADITSLFTAVDKQYRDRGYNRGECLSFDWQSLDARCALATVRWAYQGPNSETIWETTFTYNLMKQDGAWKIYVQTMHDQ